MIYYDSKYLSHHLDINPSKWKRWARTFLPPDPLGGLQSGVARQFSVKDAFKVYLGGYLVSDLKYAIPDAAQILIDLSAWLKSKGFFSIHAPADDEFHRRFKPHHIYIFNLPDRNFAYCIRTIQSLSGDGSHVKQEHYAQTLISTRTDLLSTGDVKSAQLLAITKLYRDFLQRLD